MEQHTQLNATIYTYRSTNPLSSHLQKLTSIIEEVDIPLQMPLKPKDNLTYKQRQALNKLIIDDTIIINTLDQHTIHHNTTRSQLHLNRHHNLNKMKKPTKSKDKGEPQQNTTHARSHLHEPHPQKQPYFSDQRDANNTYSTKPILQITNPPTNLRRSSLHTHKSPHKTCKHKANETPISSTPTPHNNS